MITILEADREERLSTLTSVPMPSSAICLLAKDGEERLGDIWFLVCDRKLEILALSGRSPVLKEGLVRAALNAGRAQEAEIAFCPIKEQSDFFTRLGFVPAEKGMTVSIREFFSRSCCGGRK